MNDNNYGCAEGYNSGLRHILANSQPKPDYIVVMNNDLIVDNHFLSELVNVAEADEYIGIVGPKIYYCDYKGRKDIIWSAGGKINPMLPQVYHHIGENRPDLPKYQKLTTVDWITAALFMVKIDVIDQDGKAIVPRLDGRISVRARQDVGSSVVNLILNLQRLKFENYGEYRIDLAIDGEVKRDLPFTVRKPPNQT